MKTTYSIFHDFVSSRIMFTVREVDGECVRVAKYFYTQTLGL